MYRYNYYYGHWSSDSDSDGGGNDFSYTPNVGEGGKDTGYSPAIPDPPPPPPPPPAAPTLVGTTPAIITLNEIDEYNGGVAGYFPQGQFTESRAMPLGCINAIRSGAQGTTIALTQNKRAQFSQSPMANEVFRFPYYVPPGANLSTMPQPQIRIVIFNPGVYGQWVNPGTGTVTISAVNTSAPEVDVLTFSYNTASGPISSTGAGANYGNVTFQSDQILSFIPGQFNEYKFRMKFSNPEHLTSGNKCLTFLIGSVSTSVPQGYEFEFKKQVNWETTFGINVVNKNNRLQLGTSTGVESVTLPFPTAMEGAFNWTFASTWSWNEYDVNGGFTHWEIPVTKFPGNKRFNLPITVFPENDDFCSMQSGWKLPGPKAPWNLPSRHETFWYAPTTMRTSDYAQNIPNATFYCPRNWRGIVYLKEGVANNDIL